MGQKVAKFKGAEYFRKALYKVAEGDIQHKVAERDTHSYTTVALARSCFTSVLVGEK